MTRRQRRLLRSGVILTALLVVGARAVDSMAEASDAADSHPKASAAASPYGSARASTATSPSTSRSMTGTSTAPQSSKSTDAKPVDPYSTAAWLGPARAAGHLAPGSDPSVLPGPILIADKKNDRLLIVDPQGRIRWQFPRPGDLAPGQTFKIPDDAFFSPDGKQIIATQEDNYIISIVDIATHRIVYRYGQPGVSGGSANHLNNPDDAMLLPDGTIVLADIKNCRVLVIGKGSHVPQRVLGQNGCIHNPPHQWGSPNGAFPLHDGNWLVTEINGDWVNKVTTSGHVLWSAHPPGVRYPSDSNEISPGRFLTVDYSNPGQVVIFDRHGTLLWRYAKGLNHPSLALPLPNGMILLNDDRNHRVIVVNPKTNRIVWQYGHAGISGRGAGYLNNPDGVDLVAPYGLMNTHPASVSAP